MNQTATVSGVEARQSASLLSIQVLRAVAALAVIFPHINREFALKLGLPDALPLDAFRLGNAGVDLFFVISGFIMVYVSEPLFGRRDAPQTFLLRRFARIVPIYWAVSGVLLAYILLRYPDLGAANLSVGSVVASFVFLPYQNPDGSVLPINGVGWTLNYEMFFYVVFAVALLASRAAVVIGISVLFVALVVGGRVLGPWPTPVAFWADPIILEFVFGMWIALALRRGWRLPLWGSYLLVLTGGALLAVSFFWALEAMTSFEPVTRLIGWGVPAAIMVAGAALTGAPTSSAVGWRMMGFLGDATYALYLTHPFALTVPRLLFPGLIDPAAHPWGYALLLVATAVLSAVLVHLLFEKPVTRMLHKRIARASRLRAARMPASEARGADVAPSLAASVSLDQNSRR